MRAYLIIREASRTVLRNPGNWIMQVLTLAVTLGVSALFVALALLSRSELSRIRSNLEVVAFFDASVPSDEALSIANSSIEHGRDIAQMRFTSKEQALIDFAKSAGENVQEVLGINPLPASVTVWLSDPSSTSLKRVEAMLKGISGIRDVQSDRDLLSTMESRSRTLDRVAVILVGLLLLCIIFFISTMARLSRNARRSTEMALRTMGASRSLLIGPFLLENAAAGLVGGILGALLVYVIGQELLPILGTTPFTLHRLPFPAALFFGTALIGILLSSFLSWVAVLASGTTSHGVPVIFS